MKRLLLLLITISYLLLMSLYWQTLSADESYVASQRSLKKSSFQKALSLANKSIKKNPREPRYYYGRAKVLLVSTVELSEEEKHIAKELAIEDLATALVINPTNLVTLRNTVPLYYYLAINDLNKITTENNTDEIYLETTKNYYQSLKHYSQTDVGIYTLLAKYENELGLIEDFEISKQNIQRLRPDLLQWYLQ